MIIRHDLKLIFLHVPKCAGKELRSILLDGADSEHCISLFNFNYSQILHRYVDMAHLPSDDLVHFPVFRHLKEYTVVAAVRDPYERLRSSINEYYRQWSTEDEAVANRNGPTAAMRFLYLSQLPERHSQRDPRFVHSLPITWFTHLGEEPLVDHVLRCETLASDVQRLANSLNLPSSIHKLAAEKLTNRVGSAKNRNFDPPLSPGEIAMANLLYSKDFACFNYPVQPAVIAPNDPLAATVQRLSCAGGHSHTLDLIDRANRVEWHWGPTAKQPAPSAPTATRMHLQ